MLDFQSLVTEAKQLSSQDQLRLINALWEGLPAEENIPLHEDWNEELQRRVAEIESGTAQTVTWESVRDAALKRIQS